MTRRSRRTLVRGSTAAVVTLLHIRCSAALFGTTAAIIGSVGPATPASASPQPPCGIMLAALCALVPTMPDLDHDVDLTQQSGPSDPTPIDGPDPTVTEPATP